MRSVRVTAHRCSDHFTSRLKQASAHNKLSVLPKIRLPRDRIRSNTYPPIWPNGGPTTELAAKWALSLAAAETSVAPSRSRAPRRRPILPSRLWSTPKALVRFGTQSAVASLATDVLDEQGSGPNRSVVPTCDKSPSFSKPSMPSAVRMLGRKCSKGPAFSVVWVIS